MWKAIWTGLAGLLLGVVLGESLGGAPGAVAGTVIGAVLGAPPAFLAARKRCARPSCKGCPVVCEPKRAASPVPLLALPAVVAACWLVSLALPLLPAVVVTILALCAAGSVLLVRTTLYGRRGAFQRHRRVRQRATVARPALTRGQPMLERAPEIRVTPEMIVKATERTRHVV